MDTEEALIELSKSGLFVQDGHLYKETRNGAIAGRHELSEIREVTLTSTLDYFGLTIGIGFAALAVIAKRYIDSPGWAWTVGVLLIVLSAICLISARQLRLNLQTESGEAHYDLNDVYSDCTGFAVSLRSLVVHSACATPTPSPSAAPDFASPGDVR